MAEEQVEVVRRGGIAGVAARASVDRGSLRPEVRAALEAALAGRVPATPAGGRADTFTYEFGAGEGSGRRSVRIAEHDLPPELRSMVEGLKGSWRLG